MSKPRPGKTAPKGKSILVWGKPKDTQMLKFHVASWHVAYWDNIDQAFCLSGATWQGPFIKPKFWMPLPKAPTAPVGGASK